MNELIESLNLPVSPSGRFKLLPAADLMAPAKCVICGRGPNTENNELMLGSTSVNEEFKPTEDAPYLDSSLIFEFYGCVYYCVTCTLEMASLYGALGPEQGRQLIEGITQLLGERDHLLEHVRELQVTQNALMVQYLRISGGDAVIDPGPDISDESSVEVAQVPTPNNSENVGGEEEITDGIGIPEEPEPATSPRNPEINERDSEQGRDDLRDSAILSESELARLTSGI